MEIKICQNCNKQFSKKYNYSKKYWKKQIYCSVECSGTLFKKGHFLNRGISRPIGEKSTNYRGGKNISKQGYVRILIKGTGKYQLEHRLVMELFLCRKLSRTEQVHHKNGIKIDNRIENLELIDIKEHSRLETQKRWNNKDIPFRKNLKCNYGF